MTIKQRKTEESHSSVSQSDESEFLGEYNNLLSRAAVELGDNFAAIASPTISKQETVTYLYEDCINPKSWLAQKYQILKHWLLFPLRLCWHAINLIMISSTYRVRSLPKKCVYIRSWLVPQCFVGSNVRDDYFRGMVTDLRMHENVIVALQPLGYKLIRKLRKDKLPGGYIIPTGILSLTDVFRCLFEYLFHARVSLSGSYTLRGKEIRSKINRSLLFDYLLMRSFVAYQDKYIAKKIDEAGIKAFVYVFENQSWEKAYYHVFKGSNISLIGYQSSGFSNRFLNFFPNQIDYQTQPQPHFLLTVGEGFTRYLSEHACYRSKIVTFAALRFEHPIIHRRYNVSEPSSVLHRRLLYAFPVHLTQYEGIMNILVEVFQNSSIEVHLKFHPLHAADCKSFSDRLPTNFRAIETIDNNTISETYDLVIFNDNSYGIEALIYGVKCFELDLFGNSLDERLIYFDAWRYRIDAVGLKDLRDSLEAGSFDKIFDRDAISEYINYLYRPYVGDLAIILKAINAQYRSVT
jgi:hypothetical protein